MKSNPPKCFFFIIDKNEKKERETVKLGCLSHSHLHRDHVRRQSITYLPFQSETRMQYWQNEKGRKKEEGGKEKGKFSAAKWEKDNEFFLVSQLITWPTNLKRRPTQPKCQPKSNLTNNWEWNLTNSPHPLPSKKKERKKNRNLHVLFAWTHVQPCSG